MALTKETLGAEIGAQIKQATQAQLPRVILTGIAGGAAHLGISILKNHGGDQILVETLRGSVNTGLVFLGGQIPKQVLLTANVENLEADNFINRTQVAAAAGCILNAGLNILTHVIPNTPWNLDLIDTERFLIGVGIILVSAGIEVSHSLSDQKRAETLASLGEPGSSHPIP
ncbi:hypothetical protein ACFLZP_04360 [Patescibacteria group bacterium]